MPNPDIQMEFTCFLVNQKTGRNVPERRVLKFWFREGTDYFEHVTVAYEFFKELVKPDNFPRGMCMSDLDFYHYIFRISNLNLNLNLNVSYNPKALTCVLVCVCVTDYVGFIKRIMKQSRQRAYVQVKRVQVDFTEMEDSEVNSLPSMYSKILMIAST